MYKYLAIFALIAVAHGATRFIRAADEPIPIVKSDSDVQPDGSYKFSYESGDGSIREESGVVKNAGQEDAFVAVSGMYKYIDSDGQTVEVHYTADENGFVPEGSGIPDAIVKVAHAAATTGTK